MQVLFTQQSTLGDLKKKELHKSSQTLTLTDNLCHPDLSGFSGAEHIIPVFICFSRLLYPCLITWSDDKSVQSISERSLTKNLKMEKKKKRIWRWVWSSTVSSRRTLVELQRAIDVLLYLLLISFSFFFSLTLTYYSVCDTVKTRVELQMIKNH